MMQVNNLACHYQRPHIFYLPDFVVADVDLSADVWHRLDWNYMSEANHAMVSDI